MDSVDAKRLCEAIRALNNAWDKICTAIAEAVNSFRDFLNRLFKRMPPSIQEIVGYITPRKKVHHKPCVIIGRPHKGYKPIMTVRKVC